MDRSGPGCRKADSDFTGELGCRAGHEGSHLFMPDLHEVDGAFCSIQCRHEAADAVSGIAEHPPHAPGVEAHPEEIRNGLGHGHLPWLGTTFKQIRCCCALLGRRTSDVREWDHLRYSGAQGSPSSAPNTLVISKARPSHSGQLPHARASELAFSVVAFRHAWSDASSHPTH